MSVRLILGAALLTAAAPAMAQPSSAEIVFDVDSDTLLPGQSTTVTLSAVWPADEYAFARTMTELISSSGSEGFSDWALIPPMDFAATSPGEASPIGIDGIVAWQNNVFPAGSGPDFSNPIAFWRATYTAPADVATAFDVDLTTHTSEFEAYVRPQSFDTRSYLDGLVEGNATIRVIPAPASVTVLGGAALMIRRRR